MKLPHSFAVSAMAVVVLLGLCRHATCEMPAASYELPRWYGWGSLSAVLDVSEVRGEYNEIAWRARAIVNQLRRAGAVCLIIEESELPTTEEMRNNAHRYEPMPAYLRAAKSAGLRVGIVLPSVGVDASDEQQADWGKRLFPVVVNYDFDYVALADTASVDALKTATKQFLYRAPQPDKPGLDQRDRPEWRVLRLPESAHDVPSWGAAVIGVTEAPWGRPVAAKHPHPRRPQEFEISLPTGEGAKMEILDHLIEAANHSIDTTLRLRLHLNADGTIDDKAFAALREIADWMETYGSPWDYRANPHIPRSSVQQFAVDESEQGLRVICKYGKVWVIGETWPDNGIHLSELWRDNLHEVVAVRLVGTQKTLEWEQGDYRTGLSIQAPSTLPQDLPWVVEILHQDTTP